MKDGTKKKASSSNPLVQLKKQKLKPSKARKSKRNNVMHCLRALLKVHHDEQQQQQKQLQEIKCLRQQVQQFQQQIDQLIQNQKNTKSSSEEYETSDNSMKNPSTSNSSFKKISSSNNKPACTAFTNASVSESDLDSESFICLLKTIKDPREAIVQDQVIGDTVKMFIVLPDGEQRLITFNISANEGNTVQDLLDCANVSYNHQTVTSLVRDTTYNINYIVEVTALSSTKEMKVQ